MKTNTKCAHCETELYRPPHILHHHPISYCNQRCRGAAATAEMDKTLDYVKDNIPHMTLNKIAVNLQITHNVLKRRLRYWRERGLIENQYPSNRAVIVRKETGTLNWRFPEQMLVGDLF